MNRELITIDCREHDINTKMKRSFNVVRYLFFYQTDNTDKKLIESLITEGKKLACFVNPGAANNGTSKRTFTRIICNCIAGVLSEYLWKDYLNREKTIVRATECKDIAAQIDLEIISNKKKIEVRSSFPRNGIPFAICNSRFEFDVIGPYSNKYKPGEVQKDYYVRTLFHLHDPLELITKIKQDGFEAYLAGGATWKMMINNNFAKQKNLKPHGDISLIREENAANYRVVPFSNALDTTEICNLIRIE